MRHRSRIVCTLLAVSSFAAPAALAKPPSILGTWRIASSAPAPWNKADDKVVAEDLKALIGHQMVFSKTKVTQPAPPLNPSCHPHYGYHDDGPDMLFEGGLTDPARQAAELGFKGKTIPIVETGCEGVAEFQFLDDNTILFALNNSIYRMERRKP